MKGSHFPGRSVRTAGLYTEGSIVKKELVLCWAKRLLVYVAGLFCMAVGVVLSVKSALGVSPVTSLANVVSQIL